MMTVIYVYIVPFVVSILSVQFVNYDCYSYSHLMIRTAQFLAS